MAKTLSHAQIGLAAEFNISLIAELVTGRTLAIELLNSSLEKHYVAMLPTHRNDKVSYQLG